MKYYSVSEIADKWNLSQRTIRNYCHKGQIVGALMVGKTWSIPKTAEKPLRKNRLNNKMTTLLSILKEEKDRKLSGGMYHKIQIDFTYNTNHMEGSRLTQDQTRYIYETNTIGIEKDILNVDDIIETTNHFRCIDLVIDHAHLKLTESFIKQLHFILKIGTSDARDDWFQVGDYKKMPNEVGGQKTTSPKLVSHEIKLLLQWYATIEKKTLYDLIEFHYRFEMIHPFQDGNGRIGRLILLKECLKYNIVPFIIDEPLKLYYYRGLKEYAYEKEYLVDTCLTAQDVFKKHLDYFEIAYDDRSNL
ncbi:MAG: Fic family protein [Eubacteriales bacterium]